MNRLNNTTAYKPSAANYQPPQQPQSRRFGQRAVQHVQQTKKPLSEYYMTIDNQQYYGQALINKLRSMGNNEDRIAQILREYS